MEDCCSSAELVLWLYGLAHHLRCWVDQLVVALHVAVVSLAANLREEIATLVLLLIRCLLSLHLHLLLLHGAHLVCIGCVVVALGLELGVGVGRLDKVGRQGVHVARVV